ncbi:hypothetical protein GCM10011390_02560 [Aureimonas endophytica]|uniref:Uncharacterized protein n=1 Tax=Aureimonas endophytica TaxID=2027858 RepID=A0A917E0C8_9HYPH|nr:hypothetical protein GCM10011390_02560 [Aureimonas endophytica]
MRPFPNALRLKPAGDLLVRKLDGAYVDLTSKPAPRRGPDGRRIREFALVEGPASRTPRAPNRRARRAAEAKARKAVTA